MSTDPGVDELLVRQHLRDLGVGHTPPDPEGDWWTALYPDDDPEPPDAGPDVPEQPPDRFARLRKLSDSLPDWRTGQTADLGGPDPDGDPDDQDDDPDEDWEQAEDPEPATRPPGARTAARTRTRRAQATFAGLEHRTRWLIHYGAAAGLGWGLGLEPLLGGWITEAGRDTGNPGTAVIVGAGLIIAAGLAAWRTRMWWPPLAWFCRIPVASAALALALYAPGVTP